jgi:hypothetical protein
VREALDEWDDLQDYDDEGDDVSDVTVIESAGGITRYLCRKNHEHEFLASAEACVMGLPTLDARPSTTPRPTRDEPPGPRDVDSLLDRLARLEEKLAAIQRRLDARH